jgi:hypothetical protein
VIGLSCREHVSESQLPGNVGSPLLRADTFTADILGWTRGRIRTADLCVSATDFNVQIVQFCVCQR